MVRGSLLLVGGFGALLAGCPPAEQPAACQAVLECLYPAVGESRVPKSRYSGCSDDPFLAYREGGGDAGPIVYPNQEATLEAMGPNGACWAGGPSDPYYQVCLDSCLALLHDDCARAFPDGGTACGPDREEFELGTCEAIGYAGRAPRPDCGLSE